MCLYVGEWDVYVTEPGWMNAEFCGSVLCASRYVCHMFVFTQRAVFLFMSLL